MKQILTVVFFFILHSGFSQENKNDSIYKQKDLDMRPEFIGGVGAFYKFVGSKFRSPEKPKIKGKLIVQFIVETDGTLSTFKVTKDLGYGTAEEAIRVLQMSPIWKPGEKDGQAVRSLYLLPITIQTK